MEVIRPNPIYVTGDSQSLVYGDRVLLRPGAASYVTRTLYCGLRAGDLADENDRLGEQFVAALRGARLAFPVGDRLEAFHVSGDAAVRSLAFADERPRIDPPLVFACGHLDLAQVARDFPYDDFVLPADIVERFDVLPECRENDDDAASTLDMLTLLHTRLMGFRRGLRQLRRLGFGRIALLSLPPLGGRDEDEYREIAAFAYLPSGPRRLSLRWRTKLALVMNYVFAWLCREEGIDFVDRWADQTSGGVLRPGVLLDGVHLTSAAADDSVGALVAWAEANEPRDVVADSAPWLRDGAARKPLAV